MQKFDHNIGFCEKHQIFRRKLLKIAENCDHNIGPRMKPNAYSVKFNSFVFFLWRKVASPQVWASRVCIF
jgi:hypothetical protein